MSEALLATHGRSFHLAARFLPADARADAATVYGFCRLVDDLADESADTETARRELSGVRDELLGAPPRPWVAGFLEVAERRGGMVAPALDLVDTVLEDLDPVRFADDQALLRYCYGVAGTVGLMMCSVLGVTEPGARAHAIDLGVAMQLTNICRDVAEDAERRRVYLPASRLAVSGTSTDAVLRGGAPVAGVVSDLLTLAERYYDSGERGMRAIPGRARAAILVASRVYRAIGRRLLRRHGADPWHGRTVVPVAWRLVEAALAVASLWRPRFWWPRAGSHDPALHRHLHRGDASGQPTGSGHIALEC